MPLHPTIIGLALRRFPDLLRATGHRFAGTTLPNSLLSGKTETNPPEIYSCVDSTLINSDSDRGNHTIVRFQNQLGKLHL